MADGSLSTESGRTDGSQIIEVLYFAGCPNQPVLMRTLHALLAEIGADTIVLERVIASDEAAQAERFLGSPSVRVNGIDIEPGVSNRSSYGLTCRLYPTKYGISGTPPEEWILASLTRLPRRQLKSANSREPDSYRR